MSEIVLYQNDHLQGETFVSQTAISDLNSVHFNDRTSSMLVVAGKWRLYKDANYKGSFWDVEVTGGQYGRGVYLTSTDWGGNNDDISSIQPLA